MYVISFWVLVQVYPHCSHYSLKWINFLIMSPTHTGSMWEWGTRSLTKEAMKKVMLIILIWIWSPFNTFTIALHLTSQTSQHASPWTKVSWDATLGIAKMWIPTQVDILTFSHMNIGKKYKNDNLLLMAGTTAEIFSLSCCSSVMLAWSDSLWSLLNLALSKLHHHHLDLVGWAAGVTLQAEL